MGFSLGPNQPNETPKQRKLNPFKSNPAEIKFETPLFATGNDIQSPRQIPLPLSPKSTENPTEYPKAELPSPTSAAEIIDDSDLKLEFLKFREQKVKSRPSSSASVGELALGFFILACMFWPGVVGMLPWIPRLAYEAFDPFSSFGYTVKGAGFSQ